LEENTMAEGLKQVGYKTFYAGKWHLGGEGFYPEDQGFDINVGGFDKGSPPGGYYTPYRNPKLEDGPEGEYLTDRLTMESIRFMEQADDNPFLLYLSYYTVHTPIQANIEYVDAYRHKLNETGDSVPKTTIEHEGTTLLNQVNADYASMVHSLDVNVGRILNRLDELGLADNTYVIFTSDNGGLSTLVGNRIAPTSVRPLRAGKGWCYEGGIRVPLIIRTPVKTPGKRIDEPVISMDLFATVMELSGKEESDSVDGISLAPLFKGGKISREALFWHYPHYHGSAWKPGAAIRKGDWKLVEFYDDEKTELYNLSEDVGETKNLVSKYPEKSEELRKLLLDLQLATMANFPLPNNN
jgi:arylsulfatase A-like enzyme